MTTAWVAGVWHVLSRAAETKLRALGNRVGLRILCRTSTAASSTDGDSDAADKPSHLAKNDEGETVKEVCVSGAGAPTADDVPVRAPAVPGAGAKNDAVGVKDLVDAIGEGSKADASEVDMSCSAVPPLPAVIGRSETARQVPALEVRSPAAVDETASSVNTALEMGTVRPPSQPEITLKVTKTTASSPDATPSPPTATAPGGGAEPFTMLPDDGGRAGDSPGAGPASARANAEADAAGACEARKAEPLLPDVKNYGKITGLMVKLHGRRALAKAAKVFTKKEGKPASTKAGLSLSSLAVSAPVQGVKADSTTAVVERDKGAGASSEADDAEQKAEVNKADVNVNRRAVTPVPTYDSRGASAGEIIVSGVPTLTAASGAASAPLAARTRPMAAASGGGVQRIDSLFASGGGGGINPDMAGGCAAAAMAWAPPLSAVKGMGGMSDDFLPSGAWTASGEWAPAELVPPTAPGGPPTNVYAWTPAMMYAPRAPGGGGGGGPYASPVRYACVRGGGGQDAPPQLAERVVALPVRSVAAATAAAAAAVELPSPAASLIAGLYDSDIPGNDALGDFGGRPPEMPASLYESHGPEDPAMVARVMPATQLLPPGGIRSGVLPADSFSDEVNVDALFCHPNEETSVDVTI